MKVTVSTIPAEWYHMVFNYVGTHNAEGIIIYHNAIQVGSSIQKISYARNARPGVVVIGRYFVQFQEKYLAPVMLDELLFFNRYLNRQKVPILYK